MKLKTLLLSTFALIALSASAQEAKEAAKPADAAAAAQPEMKLPPGWTEADMQALGAAATPGDQHKKLAEMVGTWRGKAKMWMDSTSSQPIETEYSSTVTSLLDGRFVRVEMKGDMPGAGPYTGIGTYGYDNVSGELVATWMDNMGTGIMVGKGVHEGNTTTWTYSYHCPITKKPAKLREVETHTGPNTMTLETFGTDPKSGKEFKMMSIDFTRG